MSPEPPSAPAARHPAPPTTPRVAASGVPTSVPPAPAPWQRLLALAVASFVMLAAGFGVGSFLQDGFGAASPGGAKGRASQSDAEPFNLYITDAVGELTALDVKVGGIFVGPDQVPMTVLNPAFDLAGLHGPGDAIPLATAAVPPDQREPVIVVFESAVATVDGVAQAIPQLAPLVLGGTAGLAQEGTSLLMDVNLAASLTERNGTLAFQPTLQAVYTADLAEVSDAASWGLPIEPPRPVNAGLGPGLAGEAARRAASTLAAVGAAPQGTNATGDLPQHALGWMVQFKDAAISREQMLTALNATGVVFVHALVSLPAAYVLATDEQAALLAQSPAVERVEREEAITYHDAASKAAMRLPDVQNPLTGLKDARGRPILGTGIGVAVVDSGIDATHPDLPYAPLVPGGVVRANYKVVSQLAVPTPNSDTTSGHGTHVASIVAGQGTSDPAQTGVAPGATLYGLGIGESATTVWASQAFDWILANGGAMDPPIRVVTNSWSSGTNYDPDSVLTRLTNRLVDQGVVVVFSAGNAGGDGTSALTSAQCQIPRPGVICVAAFDDQGTGSRDGLLPSYTSRGATGRPETWPDVSAPGSAVRAARPLVGLQTGLATSSYVELTGTSQAAPHVAGLVALMLQADGALTPAQVELILKATAYKYGDGGAYSTSGDPRAWQSHHAKGHGLVDAHAAVKAALL